MALIRMVRVAAIVPGLIWLGLSAQAQGPQTFKGRLSVVPIDVTMRTDYTGTGTASATLSGMKLCQRIF